MYCGILFLIKFGLLLSQTSANSIIFGYQLSLTTVLVDNNLTPPLYGQVIDVLLFVVYNEDDVYKNFSNPSNAFTN